MRLNSCKSKINDIILFLTMWVVEIGIIYLLIILVGGKYHYSIDWQGALTLSIVAGFVLTIIGFIGVRKDEKIAVGHKAISDAVSNFLQNK